MWFLMAVILLSQFSICIPLVEIQDIECTCDMKACSHCFCSLTPKRPKLNWANFGFSIDKPLNRAFVRTQFYNKYGESFVPVGPNYYESICNMSEARSRSRAFVVMVPDLRTHAHNFQCPFLSNVTVTEFPPNIMLLPCYVRTKNYKLAFSIGNMETNETFFSVHMHMYTSWLLKTSN